MKQWDRYEDMKLKLEGIKMTKQKKAIKIDWDIVTLWILAGSFVAIGTLAAKHYYGYAAYQLALTISIIFRYW